MRLNEKEFKRFKELSAKIKANKATDAEKAEFNELTAKRNDKGSNDPKWWLNYPTLAKDAGNLAFNVIPGTVQRMEDSILGTKALVTTGLIGVAKMAPSIGISNSESDPFNTQIRQLWLDMHRKYRGIGTYQQADLGIIILSICQAFTVLAKFERIYGVINQYQIDNRVIPYGLKESLGISQDLEGNLADFRYTLNLYIEKMHGFCLPKGLSAVMSDIVLFSNVFKDAESRRASLFVYDSTYFGVYNPTRFTAGGCVDFRAFSGYMNDTTKMGAPAFNLNDVNTVLELVVDSLLADDDVARVCSDLLAAYGSNNVETLIPIEENYRVVPVHDYERKLQFHNLTRVGGVYGIYNRSLETAPSTPIDLTYVQNLLNGQGIHYCIYQENNVVISKFSCTQSYDDFVVDGTEICMYGDNTTYSNHGKANEAVLDMWVDEPSIEEVLIATRYMTLCENLKASGSSTYLQRIAACGTQICEEVYVYYFDGGFSSATGSASEVDITEYLVTTELMLNNIDWRPFTYLFDSGKCYISGDVDNWTHITTRNLSRIHEVCLLSGYKIPMVAATDK